MTQGHFGKILQHLRKSVEPPASELTDRQLLQRFAQAHDQDAFAAMVRRHGPMVLAVARRMLHDPAAADDAFQATFLVLARKAAAPGWHRSIGSWLYQVTYRCAAKMRDSAARRRRHESQVTHMPAADLAAMADQGELRSLLDDELTQLPEKYRAPLVLCYLEGKSNEEAARLLHWPVGTVYSRLARARDLLRVRLSRRGLVLSASAVAAGLAGETATAALPTALLEATIKGAVLPKAGVTSATAVVVAEAVLNAKVIRKCKIAALLVFALALAGSGAGWLTYRSLGGTDTDQQVAWVPLPEGAAPRLAEGKPSEPVEKEGLQVTVRPAKPAFALDESLVFTVTFKNVSAKDFTFLHTPAADLVQDWFGFRRFHVAGTEPGVSWDARMVAGHFFMGLPRLPPPLVLKAGQSLDVTVKLDEDYAFFGTGNRNAARPTAPEKTLAAGTYRLTIDLGFYGSKERPLPAAAAGVAVDVEKRLADKPPLWVGELTTQPVEFEIKPVRVDDLTFDALVDGNWTIPPAGGETSITLAVRVTNHGDKPVVLNVFDTLVPHLETADGTRRWVGTTQRETTVPAAPVTVAATRPRPVLLRTATLRWSPDGRTLQLTGGDGTGGTWVMDGLKPGKYRFRFTYENKTAKHDLLGNAQPFWVGMGQTEDVHVEMEALTSSASTR